jgi:hypothetical protein
VDTGESLMKTNKFSIAQYIAPNYSLGEKNWHINPNDNPMQYIEENKINFSPTVEDILRVLEERVWKLTK